MPEAPSRVGQSILAHIGGRHRTLVCRRDCGRVLWTSADLQYDGDLSTDLWDSTYKAQQEARAMDEADAK